MCIQNTNLKCIGYKNSAIIALHWLQSLYTAPPRQKGVTDNFLKIELSPVSCSECWHVCKLKFDKKKIKNITISSD